jgi:hypothetical protein
MELEQLARLCREVLVNANTKFFKNPQIDLMMPGPWGQSDKKRLCGRRGPLGSIAEELDELKGGESTGRTSLRVFFDAKKVLKFCEDNGAEAKPIFGEYGIISRLGTWYECEQDEHIETAKKFGYNKPFVFCCGDTVNFVAIESPTKAQYERVFDWCIANDLQFTDLAAFNLNATLKKQRSE